MWPFVFAALAALVGSFQISLMNPAERIEVMLVDKNGELYSENGAHVDDYGESLPQQKNSICTSIGGSADCSLLKGELALMEKSFLLSKRWLDTLDIGSEVDSMDIQGRWYKGTVIKVDAKKNRLLIHFQGWRELYDEWIYRYSGKITKQGEKVKIKGSDMSTLLVLSGQTADLTPLFVEGLSEEEQGEAQAFEDEQRSHRDKLEKDAMRRKREKEKRKEEAEKQKEKKEKKQKEKKPRHKADTEDKKFPNALDELVEELSNIVQTGEIDVDVLTSLAESLAGSENEIEGNPVRSPPTRLQNARKPKGYTPVKKWKKAEKEGSNEDAAREAKRELLEYEKFLDLIRAGRIKKVDALDYQGYWWTGEVTILLVESDEVNISFDEWQSPFDEFIPISSGKLAPRKSLAKGGKLSGGVPGVPLHPGKLVSKAKRKLSTY